MWLLYRAHQRLVWRKFFGVPSSFTRRHKLALAVVRGMIDRAHALGIE